MVLSIPQYSAEPSALRWTACRCGRSTPPCAGSDNSVESSFPCIDSDTKLMRKYSHIGSSSKRRRLTQRCFCRLARLTRPWRVFSLSKSTLLIAMRGSRPRSVYRTEPQLCVYVPHAMIPVTPPRRSPACKRQVPVEPRRMSTHRYVPVPVLHWYSTTASITTR